MNTIERQMRVIRLRVSVRLGEIGACLELLDQHIAQAHRWEDQSFRIFPFASGSYATAKLSGPPPS